MDNKIRSHSAHSANDWRLPARSFEKRALHSRPEIGASLVMTLLLSLGLWAAIWGAVTAASAVLR